MHDSDMNGQHRSISHCIEFRSDEASFSVKGNRQRRSRKPMPNDCPRSFPVRKEEFRTFSAQSGRSWLAVSLKTRVVQTLRLPAALGQSSGGPLGGFGAKLWPSPELLSPKLPDLPGMCQTLLSYLHTCCLWLLSSLCRQWTARNYRRSMAARPKHLSSPLLPLE
jgi:hypothetical protein